MGFYYNIVSEVEVGVLKIGIFFIVVEELVFWVCGNLIVLEEVGVVDVFGLEIGRWVWVIMMLDD